MKHRNTASTETSLTVLLGDTIRPALLWAAHFILVYAALSAACAPRGLIDPVVARVFVLVVTVPIALWAFSGMRRQGTGDLERAARWSSMISSLAILFNAAPVLLMPGCG